MKELVLVHRAQLHRDRIALRSDAGKWSYQNLLDRSASLSHALLHKRRDLDESRIACLLPAGVDYIAAQWATWRAGGIFVPLCLSAAEPEFEYTLRDAGVERVVSNQSLSARVTAVCQSMNIPVQLIDEARSKPSDERTLPMIAEHRRAMILYTSGTTSRPKGVVTTHANIEAQIASLIEAWKWQETDTIPLFLPLHHIHGIINVMSCALWAGAAIEPFPSFDMSAVLNRVAACAYSVFMAVPTIYVKLLQALEAMPEDERKPVIDGFAKMRLMVSGSAALPATVHEQWSSLTGQKLLERYGMTEIGMGLSNPYVGERRPGAVGQPLPGVEIRLKPQDANVIVREGQPGEIQVRGPGVFREYWNRPDVSESSFDDGWFCTGDIAVREQGYYRIMGRQSLDIIKSGGYKLSALEIESALLDHPAISECAIVGLPDDTWGETVAAAVVLQENCDLNLESLRLWCRDCLASYKTPKRLLVVDKLPRNAMGKVTKPAIRELF